MITISPLLALSTPHVDEPIRDDRVRQPVEDVIPPGGLADRVLEGDVVARQGGADLDERGETEESVGGPVRRHQEAVQVRVFGHPFQLGQSADIARVGADDIDGLALNSRSKTVQRWPPSLFNIVPDHE